MKIQRRVVDEKSGEYQGVYQLIIDRNNGGFCWAFVNYQSDCDLPTLYLNQDRNMHEMFINSLSGTLYFREEDLNEDTTTNN